MLEVLMNEDWDS